MRGGYWDVVLSEKNEQIVGAQTFFVKSKYGLKYITQPPITQHNGIWIKKSGSSKNEKRLSDEKDIITDLIAKVEEEGFCYYQ